MKIYIDEVPVSVLLGILIRLPKILLDVIKEEIFWRRKLYPHEISGPVDFEKDWEKSMAASRRRQKHNQRAQRRRLK